MIEKIEPKVVEKKWGRELILHNRLDYCAKILQFDKQGAKFSLHFHILKSETWYVHSGIFTLRYINPENADRGEILLQPGMTIDVEKGTPHQLELVSPYGEIFEASTMHYDYDSYRIEKGDSQNVEG
jgi:mannose-6-phosphate isomerase-like protein (cupin superfamily)